jgi:hypothetical protein
METMIMKNKKIRFRDIKRIKNDKEDFIWDNYKIPE